MPPDRPAPRSAPEGTPRGWPGIGKNRWYVLLSSRYEDANRPAQYRGHRKIIRKVRTLSAAPAR